MKRKTYISGILTCLTFISSSLLAGCGYSATNGGDSDTLTGDTLAQPAPADTVTEPLTVDGIGPVKRGMQVGEWPETYDTLYDYCRSEPGGDADQYNFYSGDELQFTVMDFGEHKADLIILGSPRLKADVGGTAVDMHTPFSELLAMPGAEPVWEEYEGEGMWYWKCGGLWFAPSQQDLRRPLTDALYNPDHAPKAADFPEDVTIGYIGTGLPF